MQSHFGLGLPYCCARIGTPDTIVAKSFNRVLEGVNESLRLFDNAGNVIQHTSLNQFFCSDDRPCREYIFDPKVYFDANGPNPRFYAVALEALGRDDTNPNNDFSRIWLAVSRSPDPTALSSVQWCRYAVDGKFQRSTEPVSWADYPGLGAGTDTILVSNNQYGFTPPPAGSSGFTYALVRAFNKAVATNNASSCPSIPFTTFRPSDTLNDGAAFTLQPVQHYTNPSSFTGTTNPAYLVNTASFEGSSYRLYRVRNYASSPSMTTVANSALFSGTFTYGVPPSAPGGSGAMIDTGDTRVQQAAGVGDAIFLSHGTSCDFGGGSGEACIRLVRLIAGQSGTGDVTATLSQQITFGAQDAFYWMPGVAVNNAQDIAVPFQYSTATQPLSVRWTEKPLSSTLFAASQVLRNGFCQLETGYQGPPRNHYRSGDYTGAQRDPSDGTSFWLAGERATSFGTTFPDDTTSPTCQWETFIGKIVP